ncbi:MAG: ABC transporter substrate-binding protein [Candidatus Melainabacteria bacterium]|nr:ABC transporter substrate-binding protein [Candidatus Melainabacteria bacterium]
MLNRISHISLFLLVILLSTSCSQINKAPVDSLNIGSFGNDQKLVEALSKSFQSQNKTKINLLVIHPKQAEEFLKKNKIDLYIGTIDKYSSDIFEQQLIAKSVLVPVVNNQNIIETISKENLKQIFQKQLSNWQTLNGSEKKILSIRNDDFYTKSSLINEFKVSQIKAYSNAAKDLDVLKSIKKHPNALGIIDFQNSNNKTKVIKIDNIDFNQENFNIGYISLKRNIYVYNVKDSQNHWNQSIKSFKDFLVSKTAQNLISSLKLAPLSAAELQLIKKEIKSIKIGVGLPLSSVSNELYLSHLNSIQSVANKFNRNRSKNNPKIELIVCDDKGEVSSGIECAKLFVKEEVKAVIGHINSELSIENSKIYLKNNIIQISPCTTHPWFTKRAENNGTLFRIMSIDKLQAEVIAEAVSKLSHTKNSIKILLLDNGRLFSSNLVSQIKANILELSQNKKIKIEQQSLEEAKADDFKFPVNKKYDFLIFIGGYRQAAKIIDELNRTKQDQIIFIGSDGSNSKLVTKKKSIFDTYLIGANVDLNSPEFKNYQKKFNQDQSEIFTNEIYGYDAATVLFKALEACEQGLFKSIPEALHSMEFHSLGRKIRFDKYGDPIDPTYAVYRVQNGKFKKLNI